MSGRDDGALGHEVPGGKHSGGAFSRRLGIGLILLGIVGILWGVLYILGAVDPPGRRTFAERVPYNEAKRIIHAHFFGGLLRSLAGLCVCLLGGWVLRSNRTVGPR